MKKLKYLFAALLASVVLLACVSVQGSAGVFPPSGCSSVPPGYITAITPVASNAVEVRYTRTADGVHSYGMLTFDGGVGLGGAGWSGSQLTRIYADGGSTLAFTGPGSTGSLTFSGVTVSGGGTWPTGNYPANGVTLVTAGGENNPNQVIFWGKRDCSADHGDVTFTPLE